jgi:hypothetical protein
VFRSHRRESLSFSILSKISIQRSISILSHLLVEYGDNPRSNVTFLCGHGYPGPPFAASLHALIKVCGPLWRWGSPQAGGRADPNARPTRRWLIRTTQAFDLVNALPEGAWAVLNHGICHAGVSVFSIDSDIWELVVAFIPTIQHLLW